MTNDRLEIWSRLLVQIDTLRCRRGSKGSPATLPYNWGSRLRTRYGAVAAKLENKGGRYSFSQLSIFLHPPRQRPGELILVQGRLRILGRRSHQVRFVGPVISDGLTDVTEAYAVCDTVRHRATSRFPKSNRLEGVRGITDRLIWEIDRCQDEPYLFSYCMCSIRQVPR